MSEPETAQRALLLLTTTADDESARLLARTLVEEGLAACVTRHAVKSVYRWDSEAGAAGSREAAICEDDEVLLVIKSSRERQGALEARILALHSYECPELVAIEPDHVEAKYLAWLLAACS